MLSTTKTSLISSGFCKSKFRNKLANLLASTSPGAKQASQDVRESMLLFEHHEAVQAAARRNATGANKAKADAAAPPKLMPPVLLAAVDIGRKGERFTLIFKGPQQALAAFLASRQELHQVLDLLKQANIKVTRYPMPGSFYQSERPALQVTFFVISSFVQREGGIEV